MSLEPGSSGLLRDPRVIGVLERLWAEEEDLRRRSVRSPTHQRRLQPDPMLYPGVGFSVHPEQGEFAYMLCRSSGATTVLDVACSLGISTLYLAAAVRDNGGGTVIAAEIVPSKIAAAQRNIDEAGLSGFVEFVAGDARDTLLGFDRPLDFVLLDGWPATDGRSLARDVIELIEPSLRMGALVLDDNGETDYLDYVRHPDHGYRSMLLPIGGGGELSIREVPR